jgi:hypothetical protein
MTARTYDAAVDAIVDLLNSGYLVGYTGSRPAANGALTGDEVFTCTFGNPAFGDSTSGTATANSISDDSSATGGTVGYLAVTESDTTVVMTLTVDDEPGEDAEFDSLVVSPGVTVSCSSMTVGVV